MKMHTIPTKPHIATLLLIGALAVQPATAALAKPPLQLAQLTTAILTLPVSAATLAHPESKGLTLLDAALRATNETLATCQQESYYSAGWACIDIIQTVRALAALTAKQIPQQQDQDTVEWDDETATADLNNTTNNMNDAPTTEKPTTQWASFKRTAEYVLLTAEAAARTWAASLSNEHTTPKHDNLCWHTSEELHGLTSLIRLTRHCLHTEKNSYKTLTLVLITANAAALYFQHTKYYQPAAKQYQDELKRANNTTPKKPVNTNKNPIPTNTIPTAKVRDGISLGDNIVISRPTAGDTDDCSICLVELNKRADVDNKNRYRLVINEDSTIRTLTCGHKFHAYCIHEHIRTQSTNTSRKERGAVEDEAQCPYCMQPIEGTHNVARLGNTPQNMYENHQI